ncbi:MULTISPECIES: DUF3500 domain-containing protein [unclassified Streptomyces]|uniref:DUF3500 domain-containing protein n=1 Tax=unclassified Streptomyces TaxID=2593676 RepID=UPI0036DFC586
MSDAPTPVYGARPLGLPLKRGAVDFTDQQGMSTMLRLIGDAELPPVEQTTAEPFTGVTTDGTPLGDLFALGDDGFDATAAERAATGYLELLDAEARSTAQLPVDATEWQLWINAFLTFPEHGLLLQELGEPQRHAAMAVVSATLSPEGFDQLRAAMALNGRLGTFTGGYADTLTEWCYWFTLFGDPADGVWGWQLQGHHIDVHRVIVGRQLVGTPTFLGCEFHADEIFAEHRTRAREFMASLSTGQRSKALLYGSMLAPELPAALAGSVDGRHRAGAGRDNLVLPYEGVRGDDLSAGRRELLRGLVEPYLRPLPNAARRARQAELDAYLHTTHLAWIGDWGEGSPFYYRVHSPVVLVEYDNHPGIFLDNEEPEPYHVHTIVRTPNGGDYGKALLRRHYAREHDHSHDHADPTGERA